MSRNLAFIAALMESGVEFVAVDNPHMNKLTIHILAAVAEHEREMISERTKAALAAAKARGKVLGNPDMPEISKRGVAALKANAMRFAANVRPIIENHAGRRRRSWLPLYDLQPIGGRADQARRRAIGIASECVTNFRWCCSVLEQQRNENGRVCSKGIKGRIWPGRIEEQLGNAAAVWKPPDVAAVALVAVPKLPRMARESPRRLG